MPVFAVYGPGEIAIVFAVYLFAATAKGVTGLGFSTVCLAPLALTVGLKETLPLLLIPSVVSNILVMVGAGSFGAACGRFWPMLLTTVPGVIVGLWLLASVDGVAAGAALGVVLILWCAFAFAKPEMRLPARLERPLSPASGLLTGIVNGLTGSQVMPSMPFLMSLSLPRDVFLQAINLSFTLSSLVMAVGLTRLGLMTLDAVVISTCGIACVWIGIRLGSRIRHKLSPDQFRLMVLAMLCVMGLTLIARAL
ncbi:MAG: sulfite exporter TauE/SafE family protein [Pseudomonadota bacterium]